MFVCWFLAEAIHFAGAFNTEFFAVESLPAIDGAGGSLAEFPSFGIAKNSVVVACAVEPFRGIARCGEVL